MTEPLTLEDARYEIKFTGHATLLHALERWSHYHPAAFFEPYPARRINNVYFDTYDYSAYAQNLLGASLRQKLRLRWYGDALERVRACVELKRRRNRLGWKLSHPAGDLPLVGTPWIEIRRALRSRLPAEARLWLDENPMPVLLNSYRRRYFLSSDRCVRMTLDWDQRAFDQRFDRHPNVVRRANSMDVLVVEFKFSADERERASQVIQGFPLRASRNSKYTIGVQAIANPAKRSQLPLPASSRSRE